MTWYRNVIKCQDGEGTLVCQWAGYRLLILFEANGETYHLAQKEYQAFMRETPTEEELANRFGAKVVKYERMMKDLTLSQIVRKNWNF